MTRKILGQMLIMALVWLAGSSAASAQMLTTFYNFHDPKLAGDGLQPQFALVIGPDGDFYGTTTNAGTTALDGTVFKITRTGAETVVYDFAAQTGIPDRTQPNGLLLGSDGNFYGTTAIGGAYLVLGRQISRREDYFYETTVSNGPHYNGTVFKLTPTGTETVLYNFGDGYVDDGSGPVGCLAMGPDGNFYGTTGAGGLEDKGTVFKITPSGAETILHSFGSTNADDGAYPGAGLVLGTDGNFYGTTYSGGSSGYGTVYRISPAGAFTTLFRFNGYPDGANPDAALIQAHNGNFYGTTAGGGSASNGTVFQITPSGVFTSLCSLPGGSASSLIQGGDGNFYGTTFDGGANGLGTVFEVTPTGTETTLYTFNDDAVNNKGSSPLGALIEAGDGTLYGTASGGGAAYEGTVFMLSLPSAKAWASNSVAAAPDGTARILWTRSDGAAGLWGLDANNTQTHIGPAYGPYADGSGTWTAKALKVAPDETARLLWTRSDGAMGVWSLDASGHQIATGPTYGPYTGWTAAAIAAAPDGTARVLWTKKDGVAGLWTLGANDAETKIGPAYGPNTNWTAIAVGAAGDGTARVLWLNESGAGGIWTMNADDALQTVGPTYGPYSDGQGRWSVAGLGTSADGQSQVLWNRIDGAAGVWTFDASNDAVSAGPVYGPYPGFTAAGTDAANDQARVLWVRADRAAGVWSFGANDAASLMGALYGPY